MTERPLGRGDVLLCIGLVLVTIALAVAALVLHRDEPIWVLTIIGAFLVGRISAES